MQSSKLERVGPILLFIFTVWFFLLAVQAPEAIGESDDYMLTTVALQNHGTLQITYEDVQRAMVDFPEHAWYFQDSWEKGMPALFSLDGENVYPWYMGTYSLSCIPLKLCLQVTGLSQSYAFPLTNAAFAAAALWVCWFCLRASTLRRLLLLAALGISPIWWYIRWPSAEVFIFSMVSIGLVFYANKNYHLAGLFISIAGTMNIAVMAIGLFMIVDYIKSTYSMYAKKGQKNVFKIIWQQRISVGLLILCYVPSLITPMFNLTNFGIINLQNVLGLAVADGYIARVLSYLFDLNIGFLPYFLIAFPAFIALLVINVALGRERWLSFIYAGAFFGTVLLYAVTYHINCGMDGIPRYSSWTFPVFIFYLFLYGTVRPGFVKAIGTFGAVASVMLTLSVVAPRTVELGQTWVARMALNYLPQVYNPYPASFVSRVAGVSGGYLSYEEELPPTLFACNDQLPVVYCAENGDVRKILTVADLNDELEQYFEGSDEAMQKLRDATGKERQGKKLYYINFSPNEPLTIKDQYLAGKFIYTYGDTIKTGSIPLTLFSVSEDGAISEDSVKIPAQEGFMYGPYLRMEKGTYTITISGAYLDDVTPDVFAETNQIIEIDILSQSSEQIQYCCTLRADKKKVELRAFNKGENTAQIFDVTVVRENG